MVIFQDLCHYWVIGPYAPPVLNVVMDVVAAENIPTIIVSSVLL